ncbi:hypothetical protein ASPZODRAFT_133057 [Penicilliopsis zonata CBS 506.65]|uniref:DUF7707 domain-containing protein n=1 Tax=Penicilliopsis zonata CBS 506.65 TaxID=1073090 RepID=A0A1L9SG67_9EURO|nr:hypothetical protein ASPZODRAFT_133057 [Penicilliopsis zonata CBS 506.65]OJJ46077.1 hypothetical protein ASPZODRAFT_133057 [Penicilliopsis zonata CBS 506.65]
MMSWWLLLLAAVFGLVSGQTIDPDSVPIGTRDQWCNSQTSACPLLCLQIPGTKSTTQQNSCDPKTLVYSCVCSNGVSPNASQYSETIPYFECTESNNQCVDNCQGDSSCQSACRQDNPCGAQNPTRVNVTTTKGGKTATATDGSSGTGSAATDVVYTGIGTGAVTVTSDAKAGLAVRGVSFEAGHLYGLVAVVSGFLAGMAVLL